MKVSSNPKKTDKSLGYSQRAFFFRKKVNKAKSKSLCLLERHTHDARESERECEHSVELIVRGLADFEHVR